MNSSTERDSDPYLNSKFLVEISGIVEGGFSEISGIQVETEFEEVKEGGVNDYAHKLPKGSKQSTLVFKRGITDSDSLWKWHQDVVNGKIERKSGAIILQDFKEDRQIRWNFKDAYPIKWTGPTLNSKENSISIESLELVHNGIFKL